MLFPKTTLQKILPYCLEIPSEQPKANGLKKKKKKKLDVYFEERL